ncbi:MAG: hypothetical protein JSW20_10630 [Nitrospiraceae bacterium]|nr:MAG: hypothetical protein JSW20_10630 [Nitrospiraceae bacterium]
MENSRMKNYITFTAAKLLIILIILPGILAACSSIKTSKEAVTYSVITYNNNYQVRVRSGNIHLDKVIHDTATREFGKYLPISDQKPFTGTIDITFFCTAKRGITGSSHRYINNVVYGNKWYTGENTINNSTGFPSAESGNSSIGMFYLQKSNMQIVINKRDGMPVWSAQDAYNGVSDFSRLFVQTVDDTAAFSLDRLVDRFKHDFYVIGTLSDKNSHRDPPDASLVIKNKQFKAPPGSPGRIKIKHEDSYLDF